MTLLPGDVLLAAIVLGAALLLRRSGRRRRYRADLRRTEVDVLRALAAELTAGAAPDQALAVVAADLDADLAADGSGAVADVVAVLRRAGGRSMPRTGPRARSSPPAGLRGLVAALPVSADTGAPLADVLTRLAAAAAESAATAREVTATLSGPRLTARLLALLPLAGIGMAAASGADPVHFLLLSAAGQVCLLIGVGLDVAGLLWIERFAAGAEP